jgi:general L-amino acid transport system substrate-binding protein
MSIGRRGSKDIPEGKDHMFNKFMAVGAAAATLVGAAGAAQAGKDLDAVKARRQLICGVTTGVAGFSLADSQGKWTGLDVDLCRAVSAAIFGESEKVKYVPTTAQQRFTALQSGEVDLLARTTTWTLTRDTALGFEFTGVNYYDGQGFMVNKKLGVKSAKELDGATVCVSPGTTTELNLADYFRANKMQFKPVVIEKVDEIRAAFFAGRCDVYTTDASGLYATRAANAPKPDDYVILPEIISKEPLGPVVRQGDNQFADIVRWAFYAMLEAEEYGINSKNVDEMLKSDNPSIKRILGVTPGMGKALGLDEKWVYNIVKQVGNYSESFERNVGMGSALKIARGQNALWTQGGLQYAPPIR